MNDAYFAGLFDGEGTVGIAAPTPSAPRRYRLFVRIGMVTPAPLDALQHAYGGSVRETRPPSREHPNHRPVWYWQAQDATAAAALHRMRPALIVKRDAADIALRFADLRAPRGKPLTDAQLEERAALRRALMEVTRRGR